MNTHYGSVSVKQLSESAPNEPRTTVFTVFATIIIPDYSLRAVCFPLFSLFRFRRRRRRLPALNSNENRLHNRFENLDLHVFVEFVIK